MPWPQQCCVSPQMWSMEQFIVIRKSLSCFQWIWMWWKAKLSCCSYHTSWLDKQRPFTAEYSLWWLDRSDCIKLCGCAKEGFILGVGSCHRQVWGIIPIARLSVCLSCMLLIQWCYNGYLIVIIIKQLAITVIRQFEHNMVGSCNYCNWNVEIRQLHVGI